MRRASIALAATCVALASLAPAAGAANRRIAIGGYQWSADRIELDLGEHVTWYWVGPDAMHSVTGVSDSSRGIDSDPGVNQPRHELGDSFRVEFGSPGSYAFQCKLHSAVGGTIVVSDRPGDPSSEPDPVPQTEVDLRPPRIRDLRLDRAAVPGRGGTLRFALDERAKLDADYYRVGRDGERQFAGWSKWQGYVGLNRIRFAGRGAHFRARAGRYVAELRATDRANNIADPRLVRFEIRPGA